MRLRRGSLHLHATGPAFATLLVALTFAAPAAAAPLFVDSTGTDAANDCLAQAAPCQTIGRAVSQSSPGDTIHIAAGTYDEAVAATTDLSFVGAGTDGADKTLIDSTGL